MSSSTTRRTRRMKIGSIGIAALALLIVGPSILGQDVGFTVISEGLVEAEKASPFDLTLYGSAGIGGAGSFWANGGARAKLTLGGFDVHADASAGTDGIRVVAGSQVEVQGFRIAGDITWSPTATSVIDIRAWGSFDQIQITANARLAGAASSVSLGASTDLNAYGVSGNLSFAGGTLATASVGANTMLGDLSASLSGGWSDGRFAASGGVGLELGDLNLAAKAGYDTGLGINANASATIALEALQVTGVAMFDNTGIGGEVSGEIGFGALTATFMGRFSLGGLSLEVGGRLALGSALVSGSVAFDTQGGFSWAEVGFELPF